MKSSYDIIWKVAGKHKETVKRNLPKGKAHGLKKKILREKPQYSRMGTLEVVPNDPRN